MPLVTKKTWSAPNARAAMSCARLMLPVRLQQAVETAGRRAAFRQEQIEAVELAHVADPVGLEDRLSARDRQSVERTDRPRAYFFRLSKKGVS